MRPLHMESCTFCFPTAPRAPPLESASARNRVRLRPHPRPKTCAEHRHTRSISTIMMVKRGLKPEVDSICRTGDSRSSIIVPSRSDAEAGVELALPMACRLDGNGRATAGNRGQMAASRAQKEIVAARNRGKWAEVCTLSTVPVPRCPIIGVIGSMLADSAVHCFVKLHLSCTVVLVQGRCASLYGSEILILSALRVTPEMLVAPYSAHFIASCA